MNYAYVMLEKLNDRAYNLAKLYVEDVSSFTLNVRGCC